MVARQGKIQLNAPLSEAYRRSAQALNVVGGKVKTEDPSTGKIEGTVSMSLTSWGENILIQVSGVDDGALVRISSSSSWPTTLFDFGKNARNVRRFLDWLGR
jgi:hypothetical protein